MTNANSTPIEEQDPPVLPWAKTAEVQLLMAEYSALRDEIHCRIQAQTTLSSIALYLAAAVTGAVFLALNAYKGNVPATYIVVGLLIVSAVFAALQLTSVEHEFEMICLGQYVETRLATQVRHLLKRTTRDTTAGRASVARELNKPLWDWEVFRRKDISKQNTKWPPLLPRIMWLPVRAGRYELQLGPAIFSLLGAGVVYAAYARGMNMGVFVICVVLSVLDLILIITGIIYPWYIHSTCQPGRPYK